MRGKRLLSYNDDPWIRRLYRGRRIQIEPVELRYGISRQQPNCRGREFLIRNF